MLPWGAALALALAVLATMPHFHGEADGWDDTCVLCDAQGETPTASAAGQAPDPGAGDTTHAQAPERAPGPEIAGNGPRAPPA